MSTKIQIAYFIGKIALETEYRQKKMLSTLIVLMGVNDDKSQLHQKQ